MDEHSGSVRPAEPAQAGGGVGSWIAGVFVDPRGAFEAISARTAMPHPTDPAKTKDRTLWWVPLIIAAVVFVIMAVVIIVPYVSGPMQADAIREAILERGGTEAQVQQTIQQASAFMLPATVIGSIVQVFVIIFLVAGLVHLIMKMLGGKGSFRTARALVAYSMLVSVAGTLVKLPFMKIKQTIYIETGAAIFFKNLEPSDKLYRFLFTGLDVFTLWWIFVLGVGMAVAYRVSNGKAFTAAAIIWLLITVMGMFGPGGM